MKDQPRVFARRSSGLVNHLRWNDVFVITVAAPTGSGILYYAVRTSQAPGGQIDLAFLIGLLLFLPMVVSSAILSASMPKTGGPYVAVSQLVHPRLGYLSALLLVFGDAMIIGVLGFLVFQITGGLLSAVAQTYHLEMLGSLSIWLQSDTGAIIGGVFWVLSFWIIALQRPRIFRTIMSTMLLIPLAVTIVSMVVFLFHTAAASQSAFNAIWGTGTWQGILQAAKDNGWHTVPFSWSATFSLLLVVVWAFNGIEVASYAAEEVQAPTRSYWKGLLLGWLAVGLLYLLTVFAVNRGFGELIPAYDYLFSNHKGVLEQLMPPISPSVPFYLTTLVKSPLLAVAFGLCFALWFVKIIPAAFLATSRLLVACSIDRLLPDKISHVNPQTTAPTWAVHTTGLLALAGVFLYFLKVEILLSTLMFATMFFSWTMGLALCLLPFKMPNIVPYPWLLRRHLGIPAGTWLGGITVVVGLFLLYLTLRDLTMPVFILIALLVIAILVVYELRSRQLSRRAQTVFPKRTLDSGY